MIINKTYVDLHDIVDVFCENICSIEGFIVEIVNSASGSRFFILNIIRAGNVKPF